MAAIYINSSSYARQVKTINKELLELRDSVSALKDEIFYQEKQVDLAASNFSLLQSNPFSETEDDAIRELIESRIKENFSLDTQPNFLGYWDGLYHYSPNRGMFATISEKDSNFAVIGRGVSTLYLGLLFEEKEIFAQNGELIVSIKDINICEWVFVAPRSSNNPQAIAYHNAFSNRGLDKEGGMIQWNSYKGNIGGYHIMNNIGSHRFS